VRRGFQHPQYGDHCQGLDLVVAQQEVTIPVGIAMPITLKSRFVLNTVQ
jgi:hypothetical protein